MGTSQTAYDKLPDEETPKENIQFDKGYTYTLINHSQRLKIVIEMNTFTTLRLIHMRTNESIEATIAALTTDGHLKSILKNGQRIDIIYHEPNIWITFDKFVRLNFKLHTVVKN